MNAPSPWRGLAAEAIGTALLVATVVGSGIMGERLSGGNDALALLANTGATVAMLYVLILIFGPVSGAHFNPAVSLIFALRRDLPWRSAALYAVAQTAGGIVGTPAAHLMFELPLWQLSTTPRDGPGQWVSEAIAAFSLVLTILMVLRADPRAAPAAVALAIGAGYWFTASTSFANPAVTLARALSDSFAGIRPQDVPAFIAAQVVGSLLALALANTLSQRLPKPPS